MDDSNNRAAAQQLKLGKIRLEPKSQDFSSQNVSREREKLHLEERVSASKVSAASGT